MYIPTRKRAIKGQHCFAIDPGTAILGSSAISAGAGLGGSSKHSRERRKARYAIREGRDDALGTLNPFYQAGTSALGDYTNAINNQTGIYGPWGGGSDAPQYSNTLGAPPEYQNAVTPVNAFADKSRFNFNLENDPIYQFQRDEALEAATRGGNASGMQISGNLLQALQKTAAGEAGRYQNDAFNRQLAQSNTNYGRSVGEYGMDMARNQDLYNRQAQDYGFARDRNQDMYGRQLSDYDATMRGNQTQYDRDLRNYMLDVSRNQDIYGRDQTYLDRLANLGNMGAQTATNMANIQSNAGNNIANAWLNAAVAGQQNNQYKADVINNAAQGAIGNWLLADAISTRRPYDDWNDPGYWG